MQHAIRDGLPVKLTPAVFMKPNSLQPPEAWVEHIPFAFWLMNALRPSTFVELGTHSGNSYFAFCQAAKELGLGTQCYAVDTWQGDDHAGKYGEEIFTTVTRHHDRHYKSFSRLVRSTFDQALAGFADNSIDLLHIDGLHTYEGVRHDFESWLPKLTSNAIVLFHDTNVRDRGFGVFKLWEELAARYPSLEFLHSNGLGVISISKSPPEALNDFFAAGADRAETAKVRDVFSGLGQVVSAQLIVDRENVARGEERERLATLSVHHGAAMRRADGLEAEAKALGARAEAANAELFSLQATYRQTVAALDAHAAELVKAQQQMGALAQEVTMAKARLDQSQLRNSELADRLLQAEIRRDELEATSSSQRGRAEWLEGRVSKLNDDVATAYDQRDQRLQELAGQLAVAYAQRDQRLQELADQLAVSEEDARAQRAELAAMHARLNAPRWLARQFVWATRNRLTGKSQKKRVAKLVASASGGAENSSSDVRKLIQDSGLFDEVYYISQCAEEPAAKDDPIGHYLRVGTTQGKNPNPFFDTSWCLETHADLSANNLNPLVHYILYGSREGRATSREFDAGFYLRTHQDVDAAGLEPLRHFLESGRYEGRLAAASGQRQDGSSFFPITSLSKIGFVSSERSGRRGLPLNALLPSNAVTTSVADDRKVDVIIPIYAGLDETRRCIESALQFRSMNRSFGSLILVDDCGPEPDLRAFLKTIAERESNVVLLVNEKNLGFIKSVNRGMRHSTRDVVLLNADTEVHGSWLDRLADHAFSNPKVASVTAFSNNATICTFPDIGGAPLLPFGKSLEAIDNAFAAANLGRAVEVPTGVGFCMFLARVALNKLGLFDEAFGRGYGEETDFCQKALHAGFVNFLAGDVFVFHHGSVSFGASAAAEQLTGGAMMRERYPDYEPSVGRWISKDPALPIRFAALAALVAADTRPVILHILHPWGGGTEKQVAEIAENWSLEAHHLILITRRSEGGIALDLLTPDGGSAWRKYELEFEELAAAGKLVSSFGVTRVHVHHALEVMDELPAFLEVLNVPYDVSVHDYSLICPRNNLISEGQYCGEPDNQGCLACLRKDPAPRSRDIVLWRHKGVSILEAADRVICPTVDVVERMNRYAPSAELLAVPHEAELYHPQRAFTATSLGHSEHMRVVSIGIFAEHKGGVFLLECIERARAQGLPIKWTVIGWFPGALAERARSLRDVLGVTGPYSVDDVGHLIEEADPHLIFFPQHCAETYSYTLSEALASGRAILAPKLGAFPERISGIEGCWAYEVDLLPTAVLQQIDTLRARVFLPGTPSEVPAYRDERSSRAPVDFSFYRQSYLRR